MIALTLNGLPLPPILAANVFAELEIAVDNQVPLQATWSVWTTVLVATGTGRLIQFTPTATVTTYLNVTAIGQDGSTQTASFSVHVLAGATSAVSAWIDWGRLIYSRTDTIEAEIKFSDPNGASYWHLSWNLYRNNIWQAAGSSRQIRYENADHGVYRLVARLADSNNNIVTSDSSIVVSGGFEVQGALRPVAGGTMQLLGYVYTGEQVGDSSFSSGVGVPLSALPEELYLLPGTTHFQVEVDPVASQAPAQLVVRTPTGNWSVKGLAPRAIDLPYEFQENDPFIPAPADLRLRLSTESFATAAGWQPAFNFRVRVKCFYDRQQVFRFRACDRSTSVGGAGRLARRFTALFSHVDLLTDADTTERRLGSSAGTLQTYITDLPEVLPVTLSTDGGPDVVNPAQRMVYTDQNWVTSYDPVEAGLGEVDARSTYALEQSRPFTVSFMMPAFPTIIQRPRRLYGSIALYLANGYVNSGTVVTVNLLSAGGLRTRAVTVTVTADAYSPDQQTYVKIGTAVVDVSDAEFIDNGVVGLVSLDEAGADAGSWPVGDTRPDPTPLATEIYSASAAPYARLDGACYYNDGPVAILMGTTTSNSPYQTDATGTAYPLAADIVACYDPKCVPVGLYCYGEFNGNTTLHVPQPLYSPAPYVAPEDQRTRCYCNPCLLQAWVGTNGTLPPYPPFVAYQNGSYCGIPWAYSACNGASAELVVPYPLATVPPDYISYAGTCYGNAGLLSYTTGHALVSREFVSPVYDCQDPICTGYAANGLVVRYQDYETGRDVDVCMNHLDSGVPYFALIPATHDDGARGLTAGSRSLSIGRSLFEHSVLYPIGTGTLRFNFSPSGFDKQLLRYRNGLPTVYSLGAGAGSVLVDVMLGDWISLKSYSLKNRQLTVSWQPIVSNPRLYASSTLVAAVATPVQAVGFTGLTPRSEYAFYGTLPADVSAAEINPNGVLTVVAGGAEYVLVRARGISDPVPLLPANSVWYQTNQSLSGTLEFRLYAGREAIGQNGDLDVWLSNLAAPLPAALSVSAYQSLIKRGDPPTTNRVPDIERNSLRVIPASDLPQHRWPSAYVASDGDRLVVATATRPATAVFSGTSYAWSGTCPGLAYSIVSL